MDKMLARIRDLLLILGIFLYFTAWVYVRVYYKQFGISTDSLKLDYSSYLVYSYDVLKSFAFLSYIVSLLLLMVLVWTLIRLSQFYQNRFRFFGFIYKTSAQPVRLVKKYSLFFLVLVMASIFPVLFEAARSTAIANYKDDRINNGYGKSIQFVFRKDAEYLSLDKEYDSIRNSLKLFAADIAHIKNDTSKRLSLLAESSDYFIVIDQPFCGDGITMCLEGYIYYINKKDVLLTKIFLPSFAKP
jgi:hypothetical protein